ncbi:BTAD domain-containing putative transcriptional regulator [Saccharopolyspora sp. 5N102]|uniref:BTAD domain-containing putative transcriptional regulator n=1 Tax=Saccharopolyspora sp. 5N102 TaxID=3375155 RepID=UPI0037AD634A
MAGVRDDRPRLGLAGRLSGRWVKRTACSPRLSRRTGRSRQTNSASPVRSLRQAFGELDTPWCNAQREALHQQRLAAELDRVDVALRLGQHDELLAELSARAARYPLDEPMPGTTAKPGDSWTRPST